MIELLKLPGEGRTVHRRSTFVAIGIRLLVSFSAPLGAQSLGDIAKKTAETRAEARAQCAQSTGSPASATTPPSTAAPQQKLPASPCSTAPTTYSNKDLPADEGTPAPTSPAPPASTQVEVSSSDTTETVTAGAFSGVYKAAKAIQGATESGVNYLRFRELLQALAAEIAIARDRRLSPADVQLLTVFQQVLDHYQMSAEIWDMQLEAAKDARWNGEVPLSFNKPSTALAEKLEAEYHIPVSSRLYAPPQNGDIIRYEAIPADSFKLVWSRADEVLEEAAAAYNATSDAPRSSSEAKTCPLPALAPVTTTAECTDGSFSSSQHRSGTCSHHNGVSCWICPGVLCSGSNESPQVIPQTPGQRSQLWP